MKLTHARLAMALGVLMTISACAAETEPAQQGSAVTEADATGTTQTGPIPITPLDAPGFFVLSDGTRLKDYDSERLLIRRVGKGGAFGASQQSTYEALKSDNRMHWIVRDLDSDARFIAKSDNAHVNVYGASASKALVLGALLWSKDGALDGASYTQAIRLIARSDNSVWTPLEDKAGGRAGVQAFVGEMGYENTIGNRRSGNQINALELSDFIYDVHHRRFPGAETLYKLMSACKTGSTRAQKYLPSSIVLGGKTGSWREYNHDMRFVEIDGKRYALIVLSTASSSEKVALMFGGLVREYLLGQATNPAESADADTPEP